MSPSSKKTVAEKLQLQRARPIGGRYDLWSAFHDIELAKRFILKSLATAEKEKLEEGQLYVLDLLLPRQLPIMMVAAMESFFRSAVGELIDHGEPYAERAADLIKASNQTPDYPIFLAIQNKKFTIGQFISHMVSLNSLESITAALSTLLDADFLQLLKEVELTSKHWNAQRLPVHRIAEDPGPIFSSVKILVEIRNAIAHEGSRSVHAKIKDIAEYCDRTKVFLIAAETYFFRLLHPGEPEAPNNLERKAYAHEQLLKAEDTLAKLLDEYKNHLTSLSERYTLKGYVENRISEIDDFHKRWREFAELKARFHANEYAGGTIWGLIYTHDLEASTLARIEELREALKR